MNIVYILIYATILLIILFFLLDTYKASKQYKPSNKANDELLKVAIHEAGHLITAWKCTAIHSIQSVKLDKYEGCVSYIAYIKKDDNKYNWCSLVISLAGMAAEVIYLKKIRTGPCAADLINARIVVAELIKGNFEPEEIDGPSLKFDNMFVKQLTEQELKIFRAGFAKAKDIILAEPNFLYYANRLCEKSFWDEEDVKQLLDKNLPVLKPLLQPFVIDFIYNSKSSEHVKQNII